MLVELKESDHYINLFQVDILKVVEAMKEDDLEHDNYAVVAVIGEKTFVISTYGNKAAAQKELRKMFHRVKNLWF